MRRRAKKGPVPRSTSDARALARKTAKGLEQREAFAYRKMARRLTAKPVEDLENDDLYDLVNALIEQVIK